MLYLKIKEGFMGRPSRPMDFPAPSACTGEHSIKIIGMKCMLILLHYFLFNCTKCLIFYYLSNLK